MARPGEVGGSEVPLEAHRAELEDALAHVEFARSVVDGLVQPYLERAEELGFPTDGPRSLEFSRRAGQEMVRIGMSAAIDDRRTYGLEHRMSGQRPVGAYLLPRAEAIPVAGWHMLQFEKAYEQILPVLYRGSWSALMRMTLLGCEVAITYPPDFPRVR